MNGSPYLDKSRANEALIKRIVAKGGDVVEVGRVLGSAVVGYETSIEVHDGGADPRFRVQIREGVLYINGQAQEEGFIAEVSASDSQQRVLGPS